MECIYLIHTRECFRLKEEIYKIGRSHDLDTRVRQYAKGSKILCLISCENSIQCEKDLINLFKKYFKQIKDYGSEYFEGSKELMMKMMYEYAIEKLNKKILKDKEDKELKEVTEAKEVKKVKKEILSYTIIPKNKDRTCPKCNLKFKFPSFLRAHLKNSYYCLTSKEDIDKYITENTIPKEINNTDIKCRHCDLLFTKISSLNRHNKESKCGKTNYKKNLQKHKNQ